MLVNVGIVAESPAADAPGALADVRTAAHCVHGQPRAVSQVTVKRGRTVSTDNPARFRLTIDKLDRLDYNTQCKVSEGKHSPKQKNLTK